MDRKPRSADTRGEESEDYLELLLVPFTPERLPSPQHVAFEIDAARCDRLYQLAKKQGHKVRAQPALDSPEELPGTLDVAGIRYRNLYILDPMRINIEVMLRL